MPMAKTQPIIDAQRWSGQRKDSINNVEAKMEKNMTPRQMYHFFFIHSLKGIKDLPNHA
jgi:hypothetical protein